MSLTQKTDYEGNVTLSKFYSFSYHCISSAQPSSFPHGEIISSFSPNPPKGYIDITSTCSLISLNLVKLHDLEDLVKNWDQKSPTSKESSSRAKRRPLLSLKSRLHTGKRQPHFNSKSTSSKRTRKKSEEYWINLENNSIFYKSDHEDQEHGGSKESNEFRNEGVENYKGGKNSPPNLTLSGKYKNLEIVGTLYARVFIGPEEEEEEWEPFHMIVVKDMSELEIEELENVRDLEMMELRLGMDYLQNIDVDSICYSYTPKLMFENEVSINLFDVKKVDINGKGYGNIEKSSESSSNSESEEELNSINSKIIKIKSEIKDDPETVDTENFAKPDQIITRSNSLSQSPIATSTVTKSEEESQPDSPQNLTDSRDRPLDTNGDDPAPNSLTTTPLTPSFEILNESHDTREPTKPPIRLDRKLFESETPNNTNYSHAVVIQQNWVGMPLALIMHHLLSNVSTSNNLLISSIGVQQPITNSYKFPQASVGTQAFLSNKVTQPPVSQSTISTQTIITEDSHPTMDDSSVVMSQSQDHNQIETQISSTQTPNVSQLSQSTQTPQISQLSQSTQTPKVSQLSQSIQTPRVSQLSQECQTPNAGMVSVKVQTPCDTHIFTPPEILEASNLRQKKKVEVKRETEKTKHQVRTVRNVKKRSWTISLFSFVAFLSIFFGIGVIIIEKLGNEELNYY